MAAGNGRPTVRELNERMGDMERGFQDLMSVAASRRDITRSLGLSYGDERDIYKALGWKAKPTFDDFLQRYRRQDVAKAVIDAPVRASWREAPEIRVPGDEDSKFEQDTKALFEERNVFHFLSRVDRLGGIGQFALLLLGFNDGAEDLEQPLGRASELLYLTPYSEANASVAELEADQQNERYGKPTIYQVRMRVVTGETVGSLETEVRVHHSRVIHVAEDPLESEIYGTPQLEAIYNMLQNLELVAGSSAEMFWRGAFMGLAATAKAGAKFGTQSAATLKEQMEKYLNDMQRYLTLSGVDLQQLGPQVADPRNHVAVYEELIAAAKRIPKRILFGSERGDLASTQDKAGWAERIQERQEEHCEPVILRPFIDRCVEAGVLTEPGEDGYEVDWPDIMTPSDKEKAEVGLTIATGLAKFMGTGADAILVEELMLEKFGFTKDDLERNEALLEELNRELGRRNGDRANGDGAEAGTAVDGEAAAVPAGIGEDGTVA